MHSLLGPSVVLLSFAAPAFAADPVLLLTRRAGFVEALDPNTLATVSRMRLPGSGERIIADPSGIRPLLAASEAPSKSCCTLYTLDLNLLQLTKLVRPAMDATVSSAGRRIFTQRGGMGVEVFDLDTRERMPTISAPGFYRLSPSPDGKMMFGLTNFPQPSLGLFDIAAGALIASHPLSGQRSRAGAWLGSQFYMLETDGPSGSLVPVDNQANPGNALTLAGLAENCDYALLPTGNRFAVYESFGGKGDSRCVDSGGFFFADPATGAATPRVAAGSRFRQLIAGADARYLYGLDVGSPSWSRVQIVKLDAATGQTLVHRPLDADVWYLTPGAIPHSLAGRLDLTVN